MINNVRQQKMIDILFNTNAILTSEQLCSALNVSPRTIRSDIKEINKIISNEGAEIVAEKGKGYKLVITDEESISSFLQVKEEEDNDSMPITQDDRVEYIIVALLQENIQGGEGITQNDLSERLFISLSSLKNDMKLAKEKLMEYNLTIEKISNKGIGIIGQEEDIRYCINSYIDDSPMFNEFVNRTYINCFGAEQKNTIKNIIKKNLANFQLRLTDIAFNNLFRCINICLLRSKYGKVVSYNQDEINLIRRESRMLIGYSICNDIRTELNIELPESAQIFITKQIIASSIIAKDRQEILAKLNTEDLINYKLTEDIIHGVRENFDVDLSKDDILKDFLVAHLKSAIKRARYNVKIHNEMLGVIKNNHPFSFEIAIMANKIIQKSNGISLPEGDVGFLALHFEASMRRLEIKSKNQLKKIMIICSTGGGTSLLLKVKLEKYFGNKLVIVDTMPWYEFDEKLLDVLDFVITTIPLENNCSNKVVYVGNLLNEDEIDKVKGLIEGTTTNITPLGNSFKRDVFFTDIDCKTREEVLNFMCNELIEKSYINEEIKDMIWKREELSSTEIGDLVAIPHIMHESIEESFISVAILRKSIPWKRDSVQIVMLIGMAKHEQKKWKKTLEELYKKIIDIDNVLEIIKAKNYNDFINIILN